jgi:DNA-directed RNA polymerase beta subunit
MQKSKKDRKNTTSGPADTNDVAAGPSVTALGPLAIDSGLNLHDMMTIIYAETIKKRIAGHHIRSMNKFYGEGIKQIVTKLFPCEKPFMKNIRDKTPEDLLINSISFKVDFEDINLTPPMTTSYKSGTVQLQTPNKCRLKNLTYSAQMYIDATVTAVATYKDGTQKERKASIKNHRIASIPCMVGSKLCVTHNASRETLKALEEDPEDTQGYFIVRGMEWAVDNIESTPNNSFSVFKNMYSNEIARGYFLSKPGDHFENSYQVVLRLLNNGAITIQLPSSGGKEDVVVPFYLIFRALGMTRDQEIVSNITYGFGEDLVTRDLLRILNKAFTADAGEYEPIRKSTNPADILTFMAHRMIKVENPTLVDKDINIQKFLVETVLKRLDKFIFPHIGSGASTRIAKLRFMGHLINKLICVSLGILEPTDRDSYANKRLFSAGTSLSKSFKSHFNIVASVEIIKQLTRDFKSSSFSQVQLAESVKGAIKADDLEKSLMQAITSGNKTINIKRNEVSNRVSSELLNRKNDMNTKSVANQINTPDTTASKQNERADEMRRVHPSYLGYVDVSASADSGEKVGTSKQMASSASICNASSSWILKNILAEDKDIVPNVAPEVISAQKMSKVFVNGDWIGCCKQPHLLAYKYRQARRQGKIHHLTTIVCHISIREVYFWVDVGRIQRPLVIVYNNLQEYIEAKRQGKAIPFRQGIKLTKQHIIDLQARKITMKDLVKQEVIEYIAPGEQENCYLAMNITVLREHAGDITYRYTHVDIDQAIFGYVTLASPMGNHSNATRITYYTNHRKQSTGWFVLNYPHRIDKLTTFQHYCERPLVSTFSDAITYPNGQNCIVALIIHGGQNQEDSILVNQNSIDCGMFNASYYNYQMSELDKGEQFGNPDPLRTVDTKKDRVYEFIENDFIKKGTIVRQNYVLAIKVAKITKPKDDYIYMDKSITYTKEEPAYIERIILTRNAEDMPVVKIKYRTNRPLGIGDKMSSRSGNKGIVSDMNSRQDMIYLENGLIPDLYVNVHSIPTRMAVNQVIECLMGMLCAAKGCFMNATSFVPVDVDGIIKELKKYDIHGGYRRAYNGDTGEWLTALVFAGPTTYQRLTKYVADSQYAIQEGPTNAITRQPVDGRGNNGGIKLGEMEAQVLFCAGVSRFMQDKWTLNSDGYHKYVCRRCSNDAIVNEKDGMYKCKYCEEMADIAQVATTWSANIYKHIVNGMNVKLKYELEPYTYSRPE